MEVSTNPQAVLDILLPYLTRGVETLEGEAASLAADLEISLHRRSGSSAYSVETRFSSPDSASEMRLGGESLVEVGFNLEALAELAAAGDWAGYGKELSATFFEPTALIVSFGQAVARAGKSPLRLRMLFGPTAPELHALYWETLTNPLDGTNLAASQNILFSRYLAGSGREVNRGEKSQVKALIAAANPSGLDGYGLAAVDTTGEIARAKAGLKIVRTTSLPGEAGPCSLENLMRCLQDGYAIFYLAAHGSLVKGQAWLWLEDKTGQVRRVQAVEFASQIRALDNPPLLVVLASCESAKAVEGAALQALGPQLCEAGVPAVIAMQGKISMESISRCMPVFFEKLLKNGQVDRALASARAGLAAAGMPDFWMPVLFMRLKDGGIWKSDGEAAPKPVQQIWQLVQDMVQTRPAAISALEDLVADPQDEDNQEAFTIQIKKLLREDSQRGDRLSELIEESRKSAGHGAQAGINIQVGGNVGGNIVIGSKNTIQN